MIEALNTPTVDTVVLASPRWNWTEETLPHESIHISGKNRKVTFEGANSTDGSRVYIDCNQLIDRLVLSDGAEFHQRNIWADDCFLDTVPYTCFGRTTKGASILLEDSLFSDAKCTQFSESVGMNIMVDTARFARPLTTKIKKINEREALVMDTGWVPYVGTHGYWRLKNVSLSCTGNITHELPPDYKIIILGWNAQDKAFAAVVSMVVLALLYWVVAKWVWGLYDPPQEMYVARKKGFRLMNEMGSGRFGKVYRAKSRVNEQHVAVKVINIRPHNWTQLRQAWRECQLMSKLRHPSCIRVHTYYSARIAFRNGRKRSKNGSNDSTTTTTTSTTISPTTSTSYGTNFSSHFYIDDVTEALDSLVAVSNPEDVHTIARGVLGLGAGEAAGGGVGSASSMSISSFILPRGWMLNRSFSSMPSQQQPEQQKAVDNGKQSVFYTPPPTSTPEEEDVSAIGAPLWLQVHLVMEIADRGTLLDHVKAGKLQGNIPHVIETALDIAQGLVFLHSAENSLVHRDLSANNVLLMSEYNGRQYRAVISDFGLATVISLDTTHKTSDTKGSIPFMPPEVLDDNLVSPAVDIYSFGVLRTFLLFCFFVLCLVHLARWIPIPPKLTLYFFNMFCSRIHDDREGSVRRNECWSGYFL